jgi:hypothetical protein
MNKFHGPSVSYEVFNIVRILVRYYEPELHRAIIAKSLFIKQ